MKHLFSSYTKLAALAACALTLGSCNRSEYAMLPKSSSYHGVARVSAPVPTQEAAVPTPTKPETVATAPTALAPLATLAAPTAVAAASPSPVAAPASQAAAATTIATPASSRKLNLVQRLTLAKVTHKLEKAAQKATVTGRHNNTASTQRIDGKLRQGLILLLVGLLVGILASVGGTIGTLFAILGSILFIVGIVLIVLYLLDNL